MIFKLLVQDFVGEHKWKFISYILLIVIFFPIEGIFLPKVYGQMFDQIKTISNFSDIYNWRENFSKMNFPGALVLLIILWILVIIAYTIKNQVEACLIPAYFSHLRDVIFKQTIKTYQNDYADMKTGEYLARVLELTRNFKDLFQHVLSRFLPEFTVSLMIIGYMFTQHKHLGYILSIGAILCFIIQYFGGKELIALISDRETFFNTKLSENIRDSLDNLMNIFLNNETNEELQKNVNLELIAKGKLEHIMLIQNVVVALTQTITLTSFGLSVFYLYYLISKKKIKVTHGIVMVIILGQFINNFLYVNSGFVHNIVYRCGVIVASHDYLKHIFKPIVTRETKSGITNGSITFKNVKFRYDTSQPEFVFEDLNLHFDAGKTYALVGQSGGGKTTMMKMLAGLYTPESGSVLIDNTDIKDMDLEYLRNNVNYINQRTNLFNESVMYNMLYGNPDVTEEDVIDKLNKYDLMKVFDLTDGIQSNAGVQGGNLSGGMQRVTIMMRGILKPGKIVVIDEPTTGLDVDTTKNVADMIFKEAEGKTLIIITHSQTIRGMCNTVYDVSSLK